MPAPTTLLDPVRRELNWVCDYIALKSPSASSDAARIKCIPDYLIYVAGPRLEDLWYDHRDVIDCSEAHLSRVMNLFDTLGRLAEGKQPAPVRMSVSIYPKDKEALESYLNRSKATQAAALRDAIRLLIKDKQPQGSKE